MIQLSDISGVMTINNKFDYIVFISKFQVPYLAAVSELDVDKTFAIAHFIPVLFEPDKNPSCAWSSVSTNVLESFVSFINNATLVRLIRSCIFFLQIKNCRKVQCKEFF